MHKNDPLRKLLSAICGVLAMTVWLSPVLADNGILEGTPEISPGTTIYKAIVEPGQTYTSVFGVRGDSTDFNHYGEVTITDGTVTGAVYGCRAISGDELTGASCNQVDIIDSSVGTVYGGYAYGGDNIANVNNNTVEITGGSVNGCVYGGNADGSSISVSDNEVVINNANISKIVYGGCAFNTGSWLSMTRNSVTISGGTVNNSVYGGYANGSATASNDNTVTIEGGAIIKSSVYGGYALSSNSYAKNNTVYIKDGTLSNYVYGGVGRNAAGNTIVLYGGNLSQANLYGYSDGRKSHAANTLEVWGSNISVRSAQNFENYYFIVPDGMANQPNKYMLKVGTPVNLSGTNVGVAMQNGTTLNIGDRINLIDKTEGTPAWVSLMGKELKGGTLFTNYDFTLSTTGDSHTLVATATSEAYRRGILSGQKPAGRAIPETKALAEGQAASIALLGEGSELAAGQALADAEAAASEAVSDGRNIAAFATFGGGSSRYDTGSHVDMRSVDFVAGLAKEFSVHRKKNLLLGAFFETGHGNYSTYNHFESGLIEGDGDAHYYGGGLMFQLESSENNGLYLQAIGRMGGMSNNWSSDDFSEKVDYDTYHCYCGTAVSVGYEGNAGKYIGYDVYGKFMWNHLEGDDADIKGEHLQFQDMDSVKTRIGLRMAYEGFRILKPFIGGAWEREFSGEANAKVNGCGIDAPDLEGSTGLLELGVSCRPETSSNWRLDLSAAGYIGVRRGLSGSVHFTCNF